MSEDKKFSEDLDHLNEGEIEVSELLSKKPHACCWGTFDNYLPGTCVGICGKLPKTGEKWYIVGERPYCSDCYNKKRFKEWG